MKAIGFTSAAIVSLLFGIAAPALAQHDQQRDQRNNPPQHSSRQQTRQRERQGAWQQHRARSWESDHQSWQQRGGYQGYRVPDARFRRYFGPQHAFRVNRYPFSVVGGAPTFRYRGYRVTVVDPWPENWHDNWYETDDVYLNYEDNGYYMYNRRHPNVGIAVRLSL